MHFSPFGYFRRKTAESVLLGFGDAVKVLSPDDDEPPSNLAELRQLLASATGVDVKAIEAPEVEETPKRGRK